MTRKKEKEIQFSPCGILGNLEDLWFFLSKLILRTWFHDIRLTARQSKSLSMPKLYFCLFKKSKNKSHRTTRQTFSSQKSIDIYIYHDKTS